MLMVTGPVASATRLAGPALLAVPEPALEPAPWSFGWPQPAATASPTSPTSTPSPRCLGEPSLDCLRTTRVSMVVLLETSLPVQPVGALRQPVGEIDGHLARLVLVEPVIGDQPGEERAVHPARDVVAPRDRQERPRIVVEADRVVEPRGLGRA